MLWAYLHTNGNWLVKTFYTDEDLDEARKSDFVQKVIGPVESEKDLRRLASE